MPLNACVRHSFPMISSVLSPLLLAPAGVAVGHVASVGHDSPRERATLAGLVLAAHGAGLLALTWLPVAAVDAPTLVPIQLVSIATAVAPAPAAPTSPPPSSIAPQQEIVPVAPAPAPEPPREAAPPPPPTPEPAPKPAPRPRPKAAPRVPEPPPAAVAPAPVTAPTSEAAAATPSAASPAAAASVHAPEPSPAAPLAVSEARYDAAYLDNPPPTYPALSRRLREQGEVVLRVLVSAAGAPLRIELATSSGSTRLDRTAEEAVARWRFVPARQGERAVEAWVLVPIVFKLQGN